MASSTKNAVKIQFKYSTTVVTKRCCPTHRIERTKVFMIITVTTIISMVYDCDTMKKGMRQVACG